MQQHVDMAALVLSCLHVMSNWALTIGTGSSQLPLIISAKKRGFSVLGVDRSPNISILDDFIPISTHNSASVLDALLNHSLRQSIRAVLARTSGPALQTAALVAEYLDVPGFATGFSACAVSKSQLRKTASSLSIPCVEGNRSTPPRWIEGTDLVFKPDQPLFGKRNVFRVHDSSQLTSSFNSALEESVNKLVECQVYCPGRDLGMAVALSRGKLLWHFLYEEFVAETNGKFIGKGVAGPALNVSPSTYRHISNSVDKFSSVWNSTGFAFFFSCPSIGTPLLYEVNPGLCGDGLADKLFPAIWPGLDFFSMDVDLMSGRIPLLPSPPQRYVELIGQKISVCDLIANG